MIYNFIQEIMDDPSNDVARKILADWIEEHSNHTEASLYAKQLRNGKVNCGLLMDLYSKFGSKWERKMINRERRQLRHRLGKGVAFLARKNLVHHINGYILNWESMRPIKEISNTDTG